MAHEGRPARWEDLLASRPLFLGTALAFLACCAAGHRASRKNCYVDFQRFHMAISPHSSYYPTASQVRALGKATVEPDRIAVVVGGNSVLYGEMQGPTPWTQTLQELLGPRYRVINLAQCGAWPGEFGGTSAEILSRDHPRLILVTNTWARTAVGPAQPDGWHYRYFFWDAYYKGLVHPDPKRAARLRELDAERDADQTFAELKRRYRLDSPLRFEDLWTMVAYRHFSTVWVPQVCGSFLRPRKRYPDYRKHFVAPGAYYTPGPDNPQMRTVRSFVQADLLAGGASAGPARPAPPGGVTPLQSNYRLSIAEPLWGRTLVLVNHLSPYYLTHLTPAEQAAYARLFPETVCELEAGGFNALEVGKAFGPGDFADYCHLSSTGAVLLAEEVAPKVRELARRLGYLE